MFMKTRFVFQFIFRNWHKQAYEFNLLSVPYIITITKFLLYVI